MPTLRSLTRPLLGAALALAASTAALAQAAPAEAPRWSFAIHGGAGVIERASLSPEQDAAYRAALTRALEAGGAVLAGGGTSLDAIQAAIEIMEDDPLFNAGRGAVFTAAGRNELDAAVMNGSDLRAGAVAGLTTTRHPIAAARAVMEKSPHVMLIGPGADSFAASTGLEQVPPAFFFTERRWQGLVKALTEQNQPIPPRPEGAPAAPVGGLADNDAASPPLNERKFGTVGAVALDSHGDLAAGTSTGGMTMTPPDPPRALASSTSASAAAKADLTLSMMQSSPGAILASQASEIALSQNSRSASLMRRSAPIRAQMSRATVARMKYSPSPVAETAQPSRLEA